MLEFREWRGSAACGLGLWGFWGNKERRDEFSNIKNNNNNKKRKCERKKKKNTEPLSCVLQLEYTPV